MILPCFLGVLDPGVGQPLNHRGRLVPLVEKTMVV